MTTKVEHARINSATEMLKELLSVQGDTLVLSDDASKKLLDPFLEEQGITKAQFEASQSFAIEVTNALGIAAAEKVAGMFKSNDELKNVECGLTLGKANCDVNILRSRTSRSPATGEQITKYGVVVCSTDYTGGLSKNAMKAATAGFFEGLSS